MTKSQLKEQLEASLALESTEKGRPEKENGQERPLNFAESICAVMGELERLKKADKNAFGGYMFTSVDDFKDRLRPMMADYGLYAHITQFNFQMVEYIDTDKQGNEVRKALAQFDFDITLKHISGAQEDPERMTVALPFTGAQTSGAARSYAIKEWMKSRFLASSGDTQEEADMRDQSVGGMRLPKKDARPIYEALEKSMDEAATGRDSVKLEEWHADNKEDIDTLPQDWYLLLRRKYVGYIKDLKAAEALDRMTDEELDKLAGES